MPPPSLPTSRTRTSNADDHVADHNTVHDVANRAETGRTDAYTLYVSPTGNDALNGMTWATAKATITGAYAALPAGGGRIRLSTGSHDVGTGVWFNDVHKQVVLEGAVMVEVYNGPTVSTYGPPKATRITSSQANGSLSYFFKLDATASDVSNVHGFHFRNLHFDMKKIAPGGYGINARNVNRTRVIDCTFMGAAPGGDPLTNVYAIHADTSGTSGSDSSWWQVVRCNFHFCNAILTNGTSNNAWTIRDNVLWASDPTLPMIRISGSRQIITGNNFEVCGVFLYLDHTNGTQFFGNGYEQMALASDDGIVLLDNCRQCYINLKGGTEEGVGLVAVHDINGEYNTIEGANAGIVIDGGVIDHNIIRSDFGQSPSQLVPGGFWTLRSGGSGQGDRTFGDFITPDAVDLFAGRGGVYQGIEYWNGSTWVAWAVETDVLLRPTDVISVDTVHSNFRVTSPRMFGNVGGLLYCLMNHSGTTTPATMTLSYWDATGASSAPGVQQGDAEVYTLFQPITTSGFALATRKGTDGGAGAGDQYLRMEFDFKLGPGQSGTLSRLTLFGSPRRTTVGGRRMWTAKTTPEANVTGRAGDVVDTVGGRAYRKITGTDTTTGWQELMRLGVSKAGTISDADFPSAPPDLTFGVDTTNNRLYVRVGGTWRYSALT